MNVELQLAHAAPKAGTPLTVRALLRIVGEAPEGVEHTPMHLALVLDRSGSMSGEPIARLREAATLLIRRLWPEDRVSVVAYDNEVLTLADAASGDAHAGAATAVDGIFARGMTNLSGGWLRGRDLVEKALVPAGVNRIVLMTDGLANEGITHPQQLGDLCRSAAAAGITTTTIGFGPDFNEDLLQLMADAGGGATYYVERPDQAPGIFAEEVEGLLSLAAQNVAVEIEAGKGASLAAVRHSYPSTTRDGTVRLDVGDLYATEPRLVLMEFALGQGVAAGEEVSLGEIRVEGHVLGAGGTVDRKTVTLPMTFTLADGPRADAEVEQVALMLEAARAREEALRLKDEGEWDLAGQVLWSVVGDLERSGDEGAVREAGELREAAHDLVARSLGPADVKYMKQRAHDSRRSRMAARKKYERDG